MGHRNGPYLQTQQAFFQTQHSIIETQHSIIEAQHNIIEAQHSIIQTQHNVIETQHSIIQTQHVTSKHNSEFAIHNANLPKHNTIFAKHNSKCSRLSNAKCYYTKRKPIITPPSGGSRPSDKVPPPPGSSLGSTTATADMLCKFPLFLFAIFLGKNVLCGLWSWFKIFCTRSHFQSHSFFEELLQSTGKFCIIRLWKFPEIHTVIFGPMPMVNAPYNKWD